MDLSEDICGTLRSQMDGHPPIVMGSQQGGAEICEDLCPTITSAAGTSGNNQPVVFENHGKDSRYTGPNDVVSTISAYWGNGRNNCDLTLNPQETETYAIAGNIIGRKEKNGGNGMGFQQDISYTLTATDNHCVYVPNEESDSYQNVIGSLCRGDEKGVGNQYVDQDKCIVSRDLIRRLLPIECERLMDFPDKWTDITGASDSKRYKALGNSVVVSCVEYILRGIAYFLSHEKEGDQ